MSDEYTGEVEVGGPMDVRRLPGLTIAKLAVGPMNNNAYLLRCPQTEEGLLIDAANEPQRLRELIGFEGPPVSAIITTHRHFDHWQALAEVQEMAGAAVYAGEADADELPVAVDERLNHGDQVSVGDVDLEIIHLRGHTPGSVAVLYRDPEGVPHLFTGDSLFPGGSGGQQARGLHLVARRPRGAGLRRTAGRDLVLPRPRGRLDPRRRAPAPRGVARPGLVAL